MAVETVVYLGEASTPVAPLRDFVALLLQVTSTLGQRDFVDEDKIEDLGLPSLDSQEWQALRQFFSCPWFLRAWVAQEFIISNAVAMIYGDWSFEADFVSFFKSLNEHSFFTHIFRSERINQNSSELKERVLFVLSGNANGRIGWLIAAQEGFRAREFEDLTMLLRRDYVNYATNPRDYVYSLFGNC